MQCPRDYGAFRAHAFVNKLNGEHHVALVKGDDRQTASMCWCAFIPNASPAMPSAALRCDCGQQLAAAMAQVEAEGRGVVLYMRQEGPRHRAREQAARLRAAGCRAWIPWRPTWPWASRATCGNTTSAPKFCTSLGVKTMRLLTNNPDKVYQLERFRAGQITERVPIQIAL